MTKDVVICTLLQHVGMMCCHQLRSELLTSPLDSYLLQQSSVDALYLSRVCSVLESSVKQQRHAHMIASLVALQVRFSYMFLRFMYTFFLRMNVM